MTRRQRHNRILVGITIAFFAIVGSFMLNEADIRIFLIACGGYAAFLLIYSLICWFDVPKQLRMRPDRPVEFKLPRLGPITPGVTRFLDSAEVAKDQVFGQLRHQLFRVVRTYPEGTWTCEVEVAGDRVLAWATSYESIASPVLDRGAQEGEGRFLVVPG